MSFTETILGFAQHHPSLVGLVIFFAAMAEAIVVVGALVPGSAIVIVLAGFVGASQGRILPLIAAATVGALIADTGAYVVGRRYGMRLRDYWPFRLKPELFERGAEYFQKHGGKSIIFGRFVPGLRAIIPVAAGVLGMRAAVFFSASFVSAVAWACVHIIPAAGAGVVLNVVGRISGRLIGAVLGFLVLLAVAVFAGRLVANVIAPHLYSAYGRAIAGLTRTKSPFLRRVGVWLDPEKANLRAHIVWGVVLLFCAVGIAGIIRELASGDPLVRADTAIAQLAQSLRTQFIDRIAVVVATFGSGPVIGAAVVVLLIVLVVSHARRTAALVATVFLATVAFVPLIRFAFNGRRPLDLYPSFEAFTFPSSQATFTVLFCGVVAVLASPSLGATSRVAVWTAGILIAATVGLARIYLNLHWASDVFAGFLIGTAVTAIFALIVRDYEKETLRSLQIPLVAVLGFLLVGTVDASVNFHTEMRRYAPRVNTRVMELSEWQATGWRSLPQRRADLFGETEEKILVQVSADRAALVEALAPFGWQKAELFRPTDLLLFLAPNAALEAFPPLPLMHLGRVPDLALVQASTDPDHRTVIRLWRSDLVLRQEASLRPVLVGTVTDERVSHPYEALTILSDRPASESALARVRTMLERLPDPPFAVDLRDGTRGPLLLVSSP